MMTGEKQIDLFVWRTVCVNKLGAALRLDARDSESVAKELRSAHLVCLVPPSHI